MGHESQIELWSPNLTTFCFAGFGTERLRCEEAMKTADSEKPNRGVAWPRNRAYGAVGQNQSRSIEWAEKQEKFRPKEMCFFLTSPFILIRHEKGLTRLPTKTFLDDSARAVHSRHVHRMNLRRDAKASKHVDETGI